MRQKSLSTRRSRAAIRAACSLILAGAASLPCAAQETPPEPTGEAQPAEAPAAEPRERRGSRGARGRRGRSITALRVGMVHPVSGPAIENGVIVMAGSRIMAVGAASDIELPPGVQVREYPEAHAYPGLVDAMAWAYGDDLLLQDRASDAGTVLADGLNGTDERSQSIVRSGVTTAHVSNRGPAMWRGLGATIHPRNDGYQPIEEDGVGAVHMRVHGGDDRTHPLDRQKALRDLDKSFKEIPGYKKQKRKHEKALAKYAEEYEKYLDYFRKKNGTGEKEEKAEEKPASDGKTGEKAEPEATEKPAKDGDRESTGSEGSETEEEKEQGEQPDTEPAPASSEKDRKGRESGKSSGDKPAKAADGKADSDAPKKPEYPKPIREEPAKDALLRVVDGEVTLRIEAIHEDEIRAALQLVREQELPKVVLEVGDRASDLGSEIADAGVAVVVAGHLQLNQGNDPFESRSNVPAALAEAGVEVAIGSGVPHGSRFLPMLASIAVGAGMPEDQALAAITLVPARLLGLSRVVGSLESGKRADVVITSAPLLASDAQILAVYSGGETQFEEVR